ncbi:MAG: aminotransferase class I/II-fold pyridoxal phosphate-dependent enzyme [Mycobacteriaceae bacterium]|nr:aminotransferase class I/II-fold pyridoxal phosphate-dependent enzyme [Mycobacteriaceae bacterium]
MVGEVTVAGTMLTPRAKGCAAILGASFTIASFGVLAHLVNSMFGPGAQALLRALLASMFMFAFLLLVRRRLPSRLTPMEWLQVAAIGAAGSVTLLCFTAVVAHDKAASGTLLIFAGGTMAALIGGRLVYGERLTAYRLGAVVLVTAGLVIYAGGFAYSGVTTWIGVLGGVGDGVGNLVRKRMQRIDRSSAVALQYLVGAGVAGLYILVSGTPQIREVGLAPMVAMVVFALLALNLGVLMLYGYARVDVQTGTVLLATQVFFAIVLGVVFLGQSPTAAEVAGGLMIGVASCLSAFEPRPAPAGRTDPVRADLNEMPFAATESVVTRTRTADWDVNRYPERDAVTLRTALAGHYGLTPDRIVVGSGSIGVIQQAMTAAGPGEIAYGWPTFEAFDHAAQSLRMPVRRVPLYDNACDLRALLAAITPTTAMVIVCTPNSPTGGIVGHDDVAAFLRRVPPRVLVLLDEAYIEFVTDPGHVDSVSLAYQYPNVLVTRTFSKGYGLAGARVGYGIAQPGLARRVRDAGLPFPVPVPCQEAALAALADRRTLRDRVDRIIAERQRLAAGLRDLGTVVVEGHGNFVWLPLGEQAAPVAAALRDHDIRVKPVAGHGIRITVGTPADTAAVHAAWLAATHRPTEESYTRSAQGTEAARRWRSASSAPRIWTGGNWVGVWVRSSAHAAVVSAAPSSYCTTGVSSARRRR